MQLLVSGFSPIQLLASGFSPIQLLVRAWVLTYTASGNDHSNASLCGNAKGVDGEFMFVDVVFFFKYVVQVPNLDKS